MIEYIRSMQEKAFQGINTMSHMRELGPIVYGEDYFRTLMSSNSAREKAFSRVDKHVQSVVPT